MAQENNLSLVPYLWPITSFAGGLFFGFIFYIHYSLSLLVAIAIIYLIQTHFLSWSTKNIFALWAFYFGHTAYGISWFWGAYPLSHLGSLSPSASFWVVFGGWISVAFTISLSAIPTIAMGYWLHKNNKLHISTVAILITLMEILGAYLFASLTYAEQSLWAPHYTFNYAGYILGDTFLNKLFSPVGGVYILTFVFSYLALLVVKTIKKSNFKKELLVFTCACVVLACIQTFSADTVVKHERVAAYSYAKTNTFGFDWEEHEKKIPLITKEINTLITNDPSLSLVVLPEDIRYLEWHKKNEITPPAISIIDSARIEQGNSQARVMSYDKEKKIISIDYAKQLLVSEGEYLSVYYETLLSVLGFYELIDVFKEKREYQKGTSAHVSSIQKFRYGVTLCSEIFSPFIQSSMSNQSSVLVNLASHTFLSGHPLLDRQSILISQVRAAENNRYLVRSNDSSPALVIDNNGTIIAQSTRDGFISVNIKHITTPTFFSLYPWFIPFVFVFVICGINLLIVLRTRK